MPMREDFWKLPIGRATRSTTRTRCDVPARCSRAERALHPQPRAVLANFDQGRTVGAQRLLNGRGQVIGARGANSVTAEAVRQPNEVGASGLDADARNLPAVHLLHDLLQCIVVPYDH